MIFTLKRLASGACGLLHLLGATAVPARESPQLRCRAWRQFGVTALTRKMFAVAAHKGRGHRCGGTYPAEVRPTRRREKKKWVARKGRNVLYGDEVRVTQEASPKGLDVDGCAERESAIGLNLMPMPELSRPAARPTAGSAWERGHEERRHGQAGHRRSKRETKSPRKTHPGDKVWRGRNATL